MDYSSHQISIYDHLHDQPLASMQLPVNASHSQISEQALMMAVDAYYHPIVPKDYHDAVAIYSYLYRAHQFVKTFLGNPHDIGIPSISKPKRIRTSFIPGQILKLEEAFKNNHYLVGNDRKILAFTLGLSETQVKIWFQNRRSKQKRQKQEEDQQTPNLKSTKNFNDCQFDKLKSCRDSYNSEDEEDNDFEVDEVSQPEMLNDFIKNKHIWNQSMFITPTSNVPVSQKNAEMH